MKSIYIIDAISYLFRSYFAIKGMTNREGVSTNALFGFIRSIEKLIKDFSPEHLIAIFDGPDNKRSRIEIYKDYKGHRADMPADLYPQLVYALNYCEYAGIPSLQIPGIEADDTIGSITKWARKKNATVYLCSSDKDLAQLVDENVYMLNTYKDNLLIDTAKVEEIYGVKPHQIVDYLAIVGDASDNIPGIPGFGPKTAAILLKEFGSLNNLISHINDVKNPKQKEKVLQHKDLALISQKLATLDLHVEFPREEEFFKRKPINIAALTDLYKKMHFNTLLLELDEKLKKMQIDIPKEEKITYVLINDLQSLKNLIEILLKEKEICFDTETDILDPMNSKLAGIGLGVKPGEAWYIPTNGNLSLETIISHLKPLMENPYIQFYGHNLKYDLHILYRHGIHVQNICFDTILASYLLNPQNNRHNLDILSLEKFGKTKISIKELIGTGKKQISMLEVPIEKVSDYCCEDVDFTCRLKKLFEFEIKEKNLTHILMDIEIPLMFVLLEMERQGIYVDLDKLKAMSKYLIEKIEDLTKEIYDLAEESFNLNSPKQLGYILYEKLGIKSPSKKKATSTAADILETMKEAYPIAEKILAYRALEKLRSTYVEALPQQVHAHTKRIHPTFNQSVAATGRLSCQDPNLQNIPIRSSIGKKIREAFVPEYPDWSFVDADYSQIELRILAHLSEDPQLMEAFKNHDDIHRVTASLVFNVSLTEVTPEMRDRAKAVNFGIIYGQQAFGLSQQLSIDISEAQDFITNYFTKYPKVKAYLEECKESARRTGMAVTITGRQRPIPEINSKNAQLRAQAERLAINTPFQGSQADIIKIAMLRIHTELKKKQHLGFMILQVHDELVFECSDKQAPELQQLVKKIMEEAYLLKVPLIVDVSIGKNWGEC